jgi:agmatinase
VGLDACFIGVPFDIGTSNRSGARFGPRQIRAESCLLRPYNMGTRAAPFDALAVADIGDVAINPYNLADSMRIITEHYTRVLAAGCKPLTLGGDHTIALPLLRAVNAVHGPVAVVHFDAHLDTWDTYFGAPVTHGTPFRRAAEEKLFLDGHSLHVGVRGPIYAASDLTDDAELGFRSVTAMELERIGVDGVVGRIRERAGGAPLYLSIDIDVLDPAHAPGTGTPEAGGLTSRELLGILRGLAGMPLVGADVVEVAPAYDHAEMTTVAAAHVCYELLALLALARTP